MYHFISHNITSFLIITTISQIPTVVSISPLVNSNTKMKSPIPNFVGFIAKCLMTCNNRVLNVEGAPHNYGNTKYDYAFRHPGDEVSG